MNGAARAGVDAAGGLLLVPAQSFVKVEGSLWAIVGTAVSSHGASPHDAATLAAGSGFVKIGGVAVCAFGDAATCGHTVTPGSSVVRISD